MIFTIKHNSFLLKLLGLLLLAFTLIACNSQIDMSNLPAYSAKGLLNCIIEIPAGTNKKIEYNKTTKVFEIDQQDGKDRVINFLPYPGNYGYIPGTFSDPKLGGDGDGLDVLIISEAIPTGTVIEAIPVGMLKLIDAGEYDYKIIAIPSNPALQTVTATSFQELQTKYPGLLDIIQDWFLSYDPKDNPKTEGWVNEIAAQKEIKKSLK
jgi:inorganic pyrophosphatase